MFLFYKSAFFSLLKKLSLTSVHLESSISRHVSVRQVCLGHFKTNAYIYQFGTISKIQNLTYISQ